MKHVSSILLLAIALIFSIGMSPKSFSAETGDKVLIIIKEYYISTGTQSMSTNEAILMKQTLENAGFDVDIASASGRKFLIGRVTLESDYKLGEVNVDNYSGFMFTCSSLRMNISSDLSQVPAFGETYSKPEEVAIAKKIVDSGKLIAAQQKGVVVLAEAGVLKGKKYSYTRDLQVDDAIYGGQDVVKDGNIMTSSFCPYHGPKDQTVELTKALIAEIQK